MVFNFHFCNLEDVLFVVKVESQSFWRSNWKAVQAGCQEGFLPAWMASAACAAGSVSEGK